MSGLIQENCVEPPKKKPVKHKKKPTKAAPVHGRYDGHRGIPSNALDYGVSPDMDSVLGELKHVTQDMAKASSVGNAPNPARLIPALQASMVSLKPDGSGRSPKVDSGWIAHEKGINTRWRVTGWLVAGPAQLRAHGETGAERGHGTKGSHDGKVGDKETDLVEVHGDLKGSAGGEKMKGEGGLGGKYQHDDTHDSEDKTASEAHDDTSLKGKVEEEKYVAELSFHYTVECEIDNSVFGWFVNPPDAHDGTVSCGTINYSMPLPKE